LARDPFGDPDTDAARRIVASTVLEYRGGIRMVSLLMEPLHTLAWLLNGLSENDVGSTPRQRIRGRITFRWLALTAAATTSHSYGANEESDKRQLLLESKALLDQWLCKAVGRQNPLSYVSVHQNGTQSKNSSSEGLFGFVFLDIRSNV
jgi:hypothetical protein